MASFKRYGLILMTTAASAALSACNGADNVASPGGGTIEIVTPAPTPTPSPTPTPTPSTPITAEQFAAATARGTKVITPQEQFDIVKAGANNNVDGTTSGAALNGVYPTAATAAAMPAPASLASLNSSFLSPANYVGALSGPDDQSFRDWTCNSSTASFGGTGGECAAVPAIGTGGATAACPERTIDDGLVGGFRACRLPQQISSSLTLRRISGVFYRLRGQTEVGTDQGATGGETGITLTIEPGVVIAADSSEATPDLLLVNRGSKISAVGSRELPIIFTSQQNVANDGMNDSTQGQWGGVILLGRSTTSVCATGTGTNGVPCQQAIEGVTGRFYGGSNEADSSGRMSFVQIRYSGFAISDGNELQGLTLGGTGSGTVLDHIHIHNSSDDGIEIFGGTTNVKYIAVTGADDDSFDVDNGWRGFMQFMIGVQRPAGATNDSFISEIDSNGAEDLLPRTWGRFVNFTFIQTANAPGALRIRGGADMTFVNGILKTRSGVGCVNMLGGEPADGPIATIRPKNEALQDQGPPLFNSVYFACNGR